MKNEYISEQLQTATLWLLQRSQKLKILKKVEVMWVLGGDELGIVENKEFRELLETPKLQPKPTRCIKERDEVQKQILSLMQQEDDYTDLTFQSMAKRIRDNLSPEQRDDLVDEMFLLVSNHIRNSKKTPNSHHQLPTVSVAPGNNLGIGERVPTITPVPPMPPMQRMPGLYNTETVENSNFYTAIM